MPFRDLLISILEEEGVLYERAFAMDLDDLYSLLRAFNRRGVRFCNLQGPRGANGELLPESAILDGSDDESDWESVTGTGDPLEAHRRSVRQVPDAPLRRPPPPLNDGLSYP